MAYSQAQRKTVRLKLPVQPGDLGGLEIGTVVYLDGVIYTGREGVYKKVLEQGADLPEGLVEASNVNFHCSPAAAPDSVTLPPRVAASLGRSSNSATQQVSPPP